MIVLSVEDRLDYLEQPIPFAYVPAQAGQQVALEALAAHAAWVKGSKEIAELMLMIMESDIQQNLENLCAYEMLQELKTLFAQQADMGKTVNELHAMLKLHEQTLIKKDLELMQFEQGKNKLAYSPKPKIPPPPKRENPAKDSVCHQCGDTAVKLYTFPNKSWVYDTGCSTRICNTTQDPKGSRKIKPGVLSLYVGNGQRPAVEAIGSFHLCIPSGLVIVLKNCHYAPSINREIISVSSLYDDGFVNCFMDNVILVSKNNMVYFSDVPMDGIFEIDLSSSNINDSSMYSVSNKRAKLNLDSALLWHYRLGHISKKCIEKLQHDGLLNSTDHRDFDKCISCMSGKMARKPYTHQLERAKDLLGIIHTDICGPFRNVSRQGASYFISLMMNLAGCEALVKRDTLTKPKKLEPRYIKCIFLGYPKETMGYSFYYPPKNKVTVAQNIEFLENSLITQEASGSLKDLEFVQEEDIHPSINTSLHHEEDDLEIYKPQSDIIPIRRSTRTRHALDRMCLYVDAEEHELGDLEMQSMKDNEVWDLVDLPLYDKTVGSKWLFKKKSDIDRAVHTFKARLVVKGFAQTYRVDYEETFSPIANIRAIRILIAIAVCYDYKIWQMDTRYVFVLNGGVVDWKSTKQSIFATSSAEAEYIVAYDDSKEAVKVRKFIFRLGVVPIIKEPIKMCCDNTREITIAKESRITKHARHFRAKVHYLRKVIEYGDVKLKKVHTDDNLVDPFTIALAFPKHSEHTKNIGMLPFSSLM
nr:hypothetical protein [Tanacetum cinerariifolium]